MTTTFHVTLRGATGSRVMTVLAEDQWHARQIAIRRNVAEGGSPMWCEKVESGC